jgi:hypothetical protein
LNRLFQRPRNPQSFALASSNLVVAAGIDDIVNIIVLALLLLAGSTLVDRLPRRNEPYMSCGDFETEVVVESRLCSALLLLPCAIGSNNVQLSKSKPDGEAKNEPQADTEEVDAEREEFAGLGSSGC